ncbi:HlyD family secretion protein [Psychrobacter frigidicola]|uniref:HlyD family secretion protein n=1 Tax=Psychrobacter frigidicola TaxID=45611 RepID=UPI001918FDF9|nr:HlyD family secretion protein [Psychrobacter frigidicola]
MSQEKPNDLQKAQTPTDPVAPETRAEPGPETTKTVTETTVVPVQENKAAPESVTPATDEVDSASDEPPMPPKEPTTPAGWSPKKKSAFNLGLFIVLIIIGVLLILYAWNLPPFTPTVQQTNNAFIKGQTTIISPQVSGYVTEVAVQDFANVKADDLLIKIDDRSFQQQLEQAQANIEVAVTNRSSNAQDTGSNQAQIEAREADLNSSKVSVESARADVNRYQGLVAIGAVSRAEVAHAEAELAKAQAGVQQAEANLQVAREARKKTGGSRSSLDANIKNAEAGAKQAQINLDNTIITAPESGQLSQVSVKTGQYVSAGTQLMYIVPKGVWIIANFKETQVANMTIGESATIHVDALGGAEFKGHVSNISPATGSEFSAGAANPATGNYIKIAQRIPVRIDLEQGQPELAQLRPGMSVSVDVDTKAK